MGIASVITMIMIEIITIILIMMTIVLIPIDNARWYLQCCKISVM